MRRQTAGCNAGTARAYGHRAWWRLPRGALGMDALTTEGDARKRRQTAGCNAGRAKAYRRAWWKLPRGIRSILGVGKVLRVLSV